MRHASKQPSGRYGVGSGLAGMVGILLWGCVSADPDDGLAASGSPGATSGGTMTGVGTGTGDDGVGTSGATTSPAGTDGTGEATGGVGQTAPPAGVVIEDEMGTRCVPLCVENTDPAADPEGDDWSTEDGVSCVIPGTVTGANRACVVGEPVPAPSSIPGVVIVEDGNARCAPLCRVLTDPAADPDGDGWSYEDNASCVIPGTPTSLNQACMTGEPAPPPLQLPGVVVVIEGVPGCTPICRFTGTLAEDPDGDGWSYEDNASCVIPGTDLAQANQPCTTGAALPDQEPRPGLLLADGLAAVCRPLCAVVTTASDPSAPDWGYETNASCVLPATPTANSATRTCVFGGEVPSFVPPALSGNTVAAGFFVRDGRLLDAYGNDFVIRGVNSPHIWYDVSAQYLAYAALDDIAGFGTNTVRVVWETTSPVPLLAEVLFRIVELDMVPMVELHDVTGDTSSANLLEMARYYTRPDVAQVLGDFRQYVLVNIANEWSGNDGTWLTAYRDAIALMRAGGISHTLVIDANGFGQNGAVVLQNAAALTNTDPQRNLLFSVHMYERYGSAAAVDQMLDGAAQASIPLVVGEFGHEHAGQDVAFERILQRAQALGIGYIAWSWYGNDADTAQLDIVQDWGGPLSAWGQDVMSTTPGNISATSNRASIFQ